MVSVGAPQADSRWVFQYRRCERCGFTVRRVIRELFDEAERVKLRLALAHAFVREGREAA
jgi:ribosomal protein S14